MIHENFAKSCQCTNHMHFISCYGTMLMCLVFNTPFFLLPQHHQLITTFVTFLFCLCCHYVSPSGTLSLLLSLQQQQCVSHATAIPLSTSTAWVRCNFFLFTSNTNVFSNSSYSSHLPAPTPFGALDPDLTTLLSLNHMRGKQTILTTENLPPLTTLTPQQPQAIAPPRIFLPA
jgi:hypothetical protein